MRTATLALAASLLTATTTAHAAWGILFEVSADNGVTWARELTVDTSTGPKRVQFQIAAYHDGTDLVQALSWGEGYTMCFNRFTGTSRLESFPFEASGDQLVTFHGRDFLPIPVTATEALEVSFPATGITILGRTNSGLSSVHRGLTGSIVPFEPHFVLFRGELEVGGETPAAREREIFVTLNSLGVTNPNALLFYFGELPDLIGYPITTPTHLPATIHVTAGGCIADLNRDGFVDDSDFVLFAANYSDISEGADFTGDGVTNDDDFVIFARAYDEFACP